MSFDDPDRRNQGRDQSPERGANPPTHWRSLGEQSGSPEFGEWLHREFPEGASELELDGASRREFLRVMGASLALAGVGVSGCRRPEAHLVPYTKSVEWMIPGKPLLYATAMPRREGAMPLVMTSHDGRPTKVEGNPLVPGSSGGTDALAQASVLGLYDPDRSRRVLHEGKVATLAEFDAELGRWREEWGRDGGTGLCVLAGESTSPTRRRLRRRLLERYPRALWCEYEPLGAEAGGDVLELVLGRGRRVRTDFRAADVVLALDCDFLAGNNPGGVESVAAFSERRRMEKQGDRPNRLYAIESQMTLVGAMAEHRLRCPASQVGAAALALAAIVAEATGDAGLRALVGRVSEGRAEGGIALDPAWVSECARDLVEHRGRCAVVVGDRQAEAVHVLALGMNRALGNLGKSVRIVLDREREAPVEAGVIDLGALAGKIDAGEVRRLIVLGGNPVYDAPADLDWQTRQGRVADVVRWGAHEDETSAGARWHLPAAHFLESWGDGRTPGGVYVAIQPLILPLHGGIPELELLSRLIGDGSQDGRVLVRETFQGLFQAADEQEREAAWKDLLRRGCSERVASSLVASEVAEPNYDAWKMSGPLMPGPGAGQWEIVFGCDDRVDGGEWANNAWLQELPDPITKLTWDNAALVSLGTARELNLRSTSIGSSEVDVIEIESGGRRLEIPALVVPGQSDRSVVLTLGYGRTRAGQVGDRVGTDVYPLRVRGGMYWAVGAQLRRTGKKATLAITQEHHSVEGRDLVREATLDQYARVPTFAQTMGMDGHIPPNRSIYPHPPLDAPHQWGMVIDLNACTGCSACVVACQSENNIPVVGKEQVVRGREMHWIRIDRYFSGEDAAEGDARMVVEPMPCQHCENAPCETVCPVYATLHNPEGLNVMAYNRCVGTRYCANNCPFKVRRFNFFNYNERPIGRRRLGPIEVGGLYLGPLAEKGMAETVQMQKNPDVTVRMRGVIEKCSFCVQRIERSKIEQRIRAGDTGAVTIPTDSLQTACQQACPAGAILFGNLGDPGARVARAVGSDRAYSLLKYLNIAPRVRYLARVRNPNPRMPDASHYARLGERMGGHGHGNGAGEGIEPGHGG